MKTLICLCVLSLVAIAVASPLSREEALLQSLLAQGGMGSEMEAIEKQAVVNTKDVVDEKDVIIEALIQMTLRNNAEIMQGKFGKKK